MADVICFLRQPGLVNFAFSGAGATQTLRHNRAMPRKSYAVQMYDDKLLLRTERIRAGYTLEQLAEALGTSAQHLQRMETGERNISLAKLKQVARVLGIPPARLIPDGDGLTDDERAMIDYLRTHPRDREAVLATYDALRRSKSGETD